MVNRAAIIENGVVVNIAAADETFAIEQGWVPTETAQTGDLWDGETFTTPPAPPPTPEQVNAERDRRLVSDFTFAGKLFQRDERSLQRITGAATLAGFAIGNGAQAGDLRWANPDRDFVWIASDNTLVPMDAQTCFTFGQVAANVETSIIFAAKQLRSMEPVPDDYTDDKWWSA